MGLFHEYLYLVQLVVKIENGRQLDVLEFDVVVFVANAERIQLGFVHGEFFVGCLQQCMDR